MQPKLKESYDISEPATTAANQDPQDRAILGPDLQVLGEVHYRGPLEIHGAVGGIVRCPQAYIREGAWIRGELIADQVWVDGFVEGQITANTVTLASNARVIGTIFHNILTMENGALHEGLRPWRLNPLDKVDKW